MKEAQFSELLGKTLSSVTVNAAKDEILFNTSDGDTYKMFHYQDCCESVYIEDICGDLQQLLNSPILIAEEVTNTNTAPKDKYDEDYLWTFYKLSTVKHSVTIRWYGTSNGYYSMSVDFEKI